MFSWLSNVPDPIDSDGAPMQDLSWRSAWPYLVTILAGLVTIIVARWWL